MFSVMFDGSYVCLRKARWVDRLDVARPMARLLAVVRYDLSITQRIRIAIYRAIDSADSNHKSSNL